MTVPLARLSMRSFQVTPGAPRKDTKAPSSPARKGLFTTGVGSISMIGVPSSRCHALEER